jgi:multisubunit Na+/H+ antiporter MnhC subunit
MTTSFGSICFGSLLVAILQALKAIAQSARENGDAQILACIAECILGCLASMLEYFNKVRYSRSPNRSCNSSAFLTLSVVTLQWAFIYVGLYGMPYLKAGKSVFELFQNRGWEAIIADDLIGNVLFLISIIVGGLMGGIAAALQKATGSLDGTGGNPLLIAFLLGFVVGLLVTSILMSTIGSAVNAVIVLFAEGPAEFQQNHPDLSNKMRQVWSEVYPGSV